MKYLNRFNEAKSDYTLLEKVKDTFTNLLDDHPYITIRGTSGNIVAVTIPGIIGKSTTTSSNPKYTLDEYVGVSNTWNEILLDIQVISKYLETIDILSKLECSIDYRNIKVIFYNSPKKSDIVIKVNPKSIYICRAKFLEECGLTSDVYTLKTRSRNVGLLLMFKNVITEEQINSITEVFSKYDITVTYRRYGDYQLDINFTSRKDIYLKEII